MNKTFINKPSFYAHVISGFLIFIAFLFVINNYNYFSKIDNTQQLILLLLFILTIIGHGLFHLFLEIYYNFNPFDLFLY